MIAILIKNNNLAFYPANILIGDEIFEFNEIFNKNIKILIGKSLPSDLVQKLRKKRVIFLKLNSLEEVEGLNLDVSFPKEKIKRGVGCQLRFKGSN